MRERKMALFKDLLVNGSSRLVGPLYANGGVALNASTAQVTPEYILGVKAFADGGNIIWQNKDAVTVGNAGKLATARTLTIGNTSKTFDGSANVSWSLNEIGAGNTNRIVVQNTSVATSAWVSNSTYSDYPYRAAIAITNVTANHFPEVVFSCSDAISGNYAPVVESYAGGVYIWAKEIPSAAITIPTIECRTTA